MKLREIADLLQAEVEGPEAVDIRRVAKIEEAGDGDITFIANPKYEKFLASTRASCVIVSRDLSPPEGSRTVLLRVADPYFSFLKVLQAFHPPSPPLPPGVHATAVIAPTAVLGAGVRIGAHAVIGDRCRVGTRTVIGHGVVLGDDVHVGDDTILYHNATVYAGSRLGNRVTVHSGSVIGSDGFGFAPKAGGSYEKIPQMGIVVLEDDVEVGSNTTIDRATMGETRIKRGAKLDNLIQIAHNVVVGENTVIAAQTGVSGSTKIGAQAMIGGQVGFTGHLDIADGTKIGAQSGVHRSITTPGQTYFGYPAHPYREAFRMQGAVTQLPDLLNTVRELRKTIERQEEEIRSLRDARAGKDSH
jgi:UDP-3-O-[3-hydroxymyristoyl] glucosamine N-acyltransferase